MHPLTPHLSGLHNPAGIGTTAPPLVWPVAGLHRASPSAALDKSVFIQLLYGSIHNSFTNVNQLTS